MVGSSAVCVVGELPASAAATYNLQSRRALALGSTNSYVQYPSSLKVSHPSNISISNSSNSNSVMKKRRKKLVIVDNLGGQYEENFEDVQRQMVEFFTYKAVRGAMKELNETNPTQYQWFKDYVASNEVGYGKSFIRNLGKEKHELAERIMVTRLRLYGKWVKKCDHVEMYKRLSDQNLELLRERLLETVVWPPSDDSNTNTQP